MQKRTTPAPRIHCSPVPRPSWRPATQSSGCSTSTMRTSSQSFKALPNDSVHGTVRYNVACRAGGRGHREDSPNGLNSTSSSPNSMVPNRVPAAAVGSIDHAMDAIGVGRYQFFVLFCVSLIWAGDAMEVMVLSYLGPAAACQFGFSAFQQSLLASVVFGGMVLGAACWGVAADTWGRRNVLLTSAAVVVTAGLAGAAAPTYPVLLITRACVGFGLAGAPVAFTLLLEVLPASSRSTWGTLVELAWTAGTVFEAGVAWTLLNSYGWRWLLLASVAPLALLLLVGQRLQESPRYLAADGQTAAAEAVLQDMATANGVKRQAVSRLLLPHTDNPDQHHHQQQQQQMGTVIVSAEDPNQNSGISGSSSSRGGSRTAYTSDHSDQPHHLKNQRSAQSSKSAAAAAAAAAGSSDRRVPGSSVNKSSDPEQQALLSSRSLSSHITESDQTDDAENDDLWDEQRQRRQHRQRQQQQQRQSSLDIETPNSGDAAQQHLQTHASTKPSSQLHQLIKELKLAGTTLTRQPYASTTALMMFGWTATSFAYYGLVQLVAELHMAADGAAAAGGPQCVDGRLQVPNSDYLSVLITASAEVPAVAWAAVSANWLGKKAAVCTSLMITAACLLPVIGTTYFGADGAACGVTDAGMFGARLFVMSAFTLMWVYTPELFPTHVRALALGVNNAAARIGGLLSPFAAVSLVSAGAPAAAEGVFVAVLVAACGAVLLVPGEQGSVGDDVLERGDD